MKNFFYLIIISISLSFANMVNAAETRIAIIDRDIINSDSLALQNVRAQIDSKRLELQNEFTSKEESLRKSEEDLSKQRNILSEEAFEKKAKEFSKTVIEVQHEVSAKRNQLDESYVKAMESIYGKVKEISERVAKEENLTLVLLLLKRNQVFFSTAEVDISSKILQILNKEMPAFEIKY